MAAAAAAHIVQCRRVRSMAARAHATARMVSAEAGGRRARDPTISLFYNDVYEVELPAGHRFPMEKYRLVREVGGSD